MSGQLVCPRCGESKRVDVLRFLDDDGRAKVRLTCTLIVHEEAVVVTLDDPDVPAAAAIGGEGLVHELDLYVKLEEVVLTLDRPSEYGVVEYLFAEAYPEDYRVLWQRHGHVATHGSKKYTLSAYLSLLLGTLSRHGSVAHSATVGTGRWSYNSGISAWANPARAGGATLSWEEFRTSIGLAEGEWPPTADFPPVSSDAYWAYDNHLHGFTRLHRADCSYCNNGDGVHDDARDVAGSWLGPFDTFADALTAASRTGHDVKRCQGCSPA